MLNDCYKSVKIFKKRDVSQDLRALRVFSCEPLFLSEALELRRIDRVAPFWIRGY
jgi:hypothetical protein